MGDDWDVISKTLPCLWKMSLKVFHSPLHTHYDHATYLEHCWESSLPLLIDRYLQQSVKSEFLRSRHLIIKLILLRLALWKGKIYKKLHKICVWLADMRGFDCGFQNFRYVLSVHLTHIWLNYILMTRQFRKQCIHSLGEMQLLLMGITSTAK